MSSIDNRIVQMQFENSQFEKGIKESLKSLDDLEKKLEFKDAERGLQALQKAGDSFSLASMAQGIEKINEKFSMMGVIGKRVLEDLTDSAVRMGEKFVESVSIDQISAGWNKYTQKTEAVQTIMAATGKDIEYVDQQLSRLAWFTDETSYNFVEMAANIGKFTSVGVDLDTSVTAMEGIATWAALSGQNAQVASRAMYNMSQAMGVGSVKLMDWRSIENASMATKEFKQTAIDTAKALGILDAKGKTARGTLVTYENFAQTLNEGWFTSDVLIKTLNKYGEYADAVYTVATEKGITAAEAMELVSGNSMELGEKAFKAAQEAKTFADAIGAVKDAVSTGWMNIFEAIFGNYEEAKVLWTDLANYLWDIFAAPLSNTVDLLNEWKELGGRTKALEGIYAIFQAIADIIDTVKDAIASVFPELTADRLYEFSEAIADFGKQFKLAFGRYEVEGKSAVKQEKQLDKWLETINEGYGKERVRAIRKVQDELVRLGYLSEQDFVSGVWGPSTQKALEDFQNGVKKTADALETELKFGDRGDEVSEFQQKLNDLGFDPGGIDGIWGPKTQKAYDDYLASLDNTLTEYRELKRDMRGEDVRALQFQLIQAGYLDAGQADGIFGPKTEEALKKWQEAHHIVGSGIFNKTTYDEMYAKTVENAGDSTEYATYTIVDYSDKMKNLYYIVQGLSSALHILTSFFGFVGKVVAHVGKLLSPLIEAFIAIAAALANAITALDQWIQESGLFDKWFENIQKFLEPFGQWVQKAADGLLAFFGITKNAKDSNGELMTFAKLWNNIREAVKKTGIVDKVAAAWKKFKAALDNIRASLSKTGKAFKESLGKKFSAFISSLPDKIASVIEWLGKLASDGLELITPWIQKIPDAINKIKGFWAALTQEGDSASGKAPGFLIKVRDGFKSVIDFLFGEGDIATGKKPGLFRKLGRLIRGDLEGFTEGMDENTKKKVLEAIQNIKDFIQKVREAFVYLFGGELSDDRKISDETLEKIDNFKKSISNVFEAIGLLFTGKVKKDTGLSRETIDKITRIRITVVKVFKEIKRFFGDIGKTIAGLFTGEVKFDSIGDFLTTLWDKIKEFISNITGIASENLGSVWTGIETFFKNFWNIAKTVANWVIIGVIVYKIVSLVGNISGAFYKLKEVIGSYKKNAQALSKTVLEFAAAIGIIAASIWLIGQLDEEQFTRGVAAIGGIVAAIAILLGICAFFKGGKEAIKSLKNLGRGVMELAIGIGIIAVTIVALGALVPWDTLLSGIGKLAIVMLVMVGFMWAINKVSNTTSIKLKGFWQIALVIGVMSFIAVKLGTVPLGQLLQGVIALGVIMGMLSHFIKVMGKVGATNIKMKGFIALSLAIGILAIIVSALGKMPLKRLAKGIGSLFIICLALSSVMKAMGSIKKPNIGGLIATIVLVGLIMAGLAVALQYVKDIDFKVILAFSAGLALLLASLGVFAKLSSGATFTGVSAAALGLLEVIAVISIVVAAYGALDQIPGFREFMNGGAEAIGEMLGSFLSGFGNVFDFNGMSAFGEGMNSLSDLPEADQEGVENAIAQAKLLQQFAEGLPGKEIVTKVVDFIFGSEFKQFSQDMAAFGTGFYNFAEQINAVGTWDGLEDKTSTAITIAGAIRDFSGTLPEKDNLTKIVDRLFNSEMEQFSDDMSAFGTGFYNFAEQINAVGTWDGLEEKATTAVTIANSIKALSSDLPEKDNLTKIVNTLFNSEMEQFSEDMVDFGSGFNKFAEQINAVETWEGLEEKAIRATFIASAIKAFSSDLPEKENITKIVDTLFNSEMEQFAEDMTAFGTGFNKFAIELNSIRSWKGLENKTNMAISIANSIKTFSDSLPDQDALTQIVNSWFKTKMEQFSDDMAGFASGFNAFSSEMKQVKLDPLIQTKTTNAIGIATQIATFLDSLSSLNIETKAGGIAGWLQGDTKQETVFDSVAELATLIKNHSSDFSGISSGTLESDVKSAVVIARVVASLLSYLNSDQFNFITVESVNDMGQTAFNYLMSHIASFASTIQQFNSDIKNVDISRVTSVMDSITSLMSLMTEGKEFDASNLLSFLDADNISSVLNTAMINIQAAFNEQETQLIEVIEAMATDVSPSFQNAGITLSNSLNTGIANPNTNGLGALVVKMLFECKKYVESFKTAGGNFAVGLANGVAFKSRAAVDAAKAVATYMLLAAQKVFNSHSPSRETMKLGNYFTDGLAIGTEEKVGEAANAASRVADAMLATASGTMATLSELLADDIDVNPVISPVVDLSDARASAAMIGGLFGNQSFGVSSQMMARSAQVSTNNGRPITIQNGTLNTSEAMSSVNEKLNALSAALNSRNDGPHVDPMETLGEKFGDLADAVTNLKIVLDSGTLVGEISSMMDADLGTLATRRDRGN